MQKKDVSMNLWNVANVLRDDGISYHGYIQELTNILFLKFIGKLGIENQIPQKYTWDELASKKGIELYNLYRELLLYLDINGEGAIKEIYSNASTSIQSPINLEKIIKAVDLISWEDIHNEDLGNIYDSLIEKSVMEVKTGMGQYYTPRVLINVLVKLIEPKLGEKCGDPACGTFGFMIAAANYIVNTSEFDVGVNDVLEKTSFWGCELVRDVYRIGVMNSMLHGLEANILLGDVLSKVGEKMMNMDVILTSPPFGTKKGGEAPSIQNLPFETLDKQLNFLQYVYQALNPTTGTARAAVIVPDYVLFDAGIGKKVRKDLMEKCNLHTILRLPVGIFYARGVKANVLFFTRGKTDINNTKEVWVYDLRTDAPKIGRRNPLIEEHFKDFVDAYTSRNHENVENNRWSTFTYQQIKDREYNLDIGLIENDSIGMFQKYSNPIDSTEEAILKLNQAVGLLNQVLVELKVIEGDSNE
ncbi:SAM-dependent methyltransferase [Bacillus thuringiensis]|uniref:class I SAM-dependent DNA methyltransferase n=1 Tax=Bacillus thuringiensis TaxID=1428 RepID=UPI000BEE49D9|nr:N-6 DNA methylase [Bacillus thuringiensis]PEA58042.1 SAM-dependent methyltransferase [Bacillus thuringiensis]HDR8143067.1 N-6 DNA methylase [Bacillus cereus]